MYEYCEHHAIPHERCGKLIVALRTDELRRLDELEARAAPIRCLVCGALVLMRSLRSSPMALGCKRFTHLTPGWSTMAQCQRFLHPNWSGSVRTSGSARRSWRSAATV